MATRELREFSKVTADREQIAFLQIDNNLTELRLTSMAMFVQEMEAFQGSLQNNEYVSAAQVIRNLIDSVSKILNEFYGFRISIENLRSYSYKTIVKYYQESAMHVLEGNAPANSEIAPPEIPQIVSDMTRLLKTNDKFEGWNSNSAVIVDAFLNASTNQTVKPVK